MAMTRARYVSSKVFATNADYRIGGATRLSQKPLFLLDGAREPQSYPCTVSVGGRLLQHRRRDQHR